MSDTFPSPIADWTDRTLNFAAPLEAMRAAWESGDQAAASTPARPGAGTAPLSFVNERSRTIPLSFPFHHDGKLIDHVVVTRLVTRDVAALVAQDTGDPYHAYSMMTGLPPDVLRGLDADDGERVVEAAYDFLPRVFRKEDASPSP